MIQGQVAFGIVVFDSSRDPVVRPGEQVYGLNLDGVAVLGAAPIDAKVVEDIEHIGRCSATLITDRHLLTAAHFLDGDYDGIVQVDVGTLAAGFELADREVIIPITPGSAQLPTLPVDAWPFSNYPDIAVLELTEPAPAE